jgi:hypothetical protein
MQKLRAAALLVSGLIIGAGSVEAFHSIHDRQKHELFEQKLRCKTLGETYAKKASDEYTSVFLDRVDFSKTRNSCVASVLNTSAGRFMTYQVVDVVTGDLLSTGSCDDKDSQSRSFCGKGKDISLIQERDAAFDRLVR